MKTKQQHTAYESLLNLILNLIENHNHEEALAISQGLLVQLLQGDIKRREEFRKLAGTLAPIPFTDEVEVETKARTTAKESMPKPEEKGMSPEKALANMYGFTPYQNVGRDAMESLGQLLEKRLAETKAPELTEDEKLELSLLSSKATKATEDKTCIKCPRDEHKACGYCGLIQAEADTMVWSTVWNCWLKQKRDN